MSFEAPSCLFSVNLASMTLRLGRRRTAQKNPNFMILFPIRKTVFLILLLPSQLLKAETITAPMQIDFPLLRQVVVSQLFKSESASTELLHDPTGCSEIVLSDPKLSELNRYLQIETRFSAKLAVNMLGRCTPLLNWNGFAQIIAEPVIKTGNPRMVYLQVVDSHLADTNNERLTSGPLWNQARKHIHPLFDRFRLDLAPSINELKAFLPLFLPQHSHTQLNNTLDSLHLDNLQVVTNGIRSDLMFYLETSDLPKKRERPLTEQEQLEWRQKWQSMDALLTHAIKQYAAATEFTQLRLALFDILLDARYQLQEALQQDQGDDPVRHWFIDSWSKLIPVLRQITAENPQHATLSLMTLLTASDALQALDRLSPAFGLDISIDGLRRLARLLNASPEIDPLQYNEALDPELLRLFQLTPPADNSSQHKINLWPLNTAMASVSRPLNNWVPASEELDSYLQQIRELLINTASGIVSRSVLTAVQQDIFKKLVLSTAWQESCWRQYIVSGNKIVPLQSSTGDTGIMQINERVWRGFVDATNDLSENEKAALFRDNARQFYRVPGQDKSGEQ